MTATNGDAPQPQAYRVTVSPSGLEGHLDYELARLAPDGVSWVPLEPLRTPMCLPQQACAVALHWLRIHESRLTIAPADLDFLFTAERGAPRAVSKPIRY